MEVHVVSEHLEGSVHAIDEAAVARREFLASCGKFAAVTPPAITLLLSTSMSSTATATSGGGDGGGGLLGDIVDEILP